jgi:molybdenum cofactor sulfurtransferase
LDHTGTPPYPSGLVDATSTVLKERLLGNPHALNASSRLSNELVEQTRERVLSMFGVSSSQYHLIFTSGATSALSLLAYSYPWTPDTSYVYLEESHTSVLGVREVALERGAKATPLSKQEVYESFTYFIPLF